MVANSKPISSSRCQTHKLVARRRAREVKGKVKWIPWTYLAPSGREEMLMFPIPAKFDSEGRRILSASSGKRYCGVPKVGYKDSFGKIKCVMPSIKDIANMSTKYRRENYV